MRNKKNIVIGITCACAILVSVGCRSARYKREAKGLANEEHVAAVTVEGVPGGVVVGTMAVQAKVLDVDLRNGQVKLLIPGGHAIKTKVDESAVHLEQVKKGDIVNAVITEELVFQLASSEAEMKDHADIVAALSEKDEMPAGVVATAVRVSATIAAIDADAHTVSLTLKDGTTKTVPVRDDVEMNQAKVGDQVVIDLFEAVALSIEHVEATK